MQLTDYLNWTNSTAIYPQENELTYLYFNTVSEVGEVLGKVAKLYRGDKSLEQMYPEIAKELSDVCWHLSQYSRRFNFTPENLELGAKPANNLEIINKWALKLKEECERWLADVDLGITSTSSLESFWYTTQCLISRIGYTLEEILQINYDKLTDREERGVLAGSGDNR